jgi:hypothetical protein
MILPEGSPPIDSSNADIPLDKFCNFLHLCLSMLSPVLWESLLVDGLGLPLNPLFHYLGPVGYWNCPRNDLFKARVSDFGAFSVEYGGAYEHDSHF